MLSIVFPAERPSTPEAPPVSANAAQDAAVVLLQRLLRGRAAQNEMYAAKTARLELVKELRLGVEGRAGKGDDRDSSRLGCLYCMHT